MDDVPVYVRFGLYESFSVEWGRHEMLFGRGGD